MFLTTPEAHLRRGNIFRVSTTRLLVFSERWRRRVRFGAVAAARTSVLSFHQMSGPVGEHIGITTIECYSLEQLGSDDREAVERHLRICAGCRDRLVGVEPFNTIHYTPEGPFYSRITQLRDGSFHARHWGCQIDGGDNYLDLDAARTYLLESFVQMFPEHECGKACHGPRR